MITGVIDAPALIDIKTNLFESSNATYEFILILQSEDGRVNYIKQRLISSSIDLYPHVNIR